MTACRVSAPIITAVLPSPGIPRLSIGTMAPPLTELFAVSDAINPEGSPFPKSSGFLARRFASA